MGLLIVVFHGIYKFSWLMMKNPMIYRKWEWYVMIVIYRKLLPSGYD